MRRMVRHARPIRRDIGRTTSMSTWMVIASVWAMFAVCVVLFVRGASPHVQRSDKTTDEPDRPAGDVSRAKV
jgi:hypothetical protein